MCSTKLGLGDNFKIFQLRPSKKQKFKFYPYTQATQHPFNLFHLSVFRTQINKVETDAAYPSSGLKFLKPVHKLVVNRFVSSSRFPSSQYNPMSGNSQFHHPFHRYRQNRTPFSLNRQTREPYRASSDRRLNPVRTELCSGNRKYTQRACPLFAVYDESAQEPRKKMLKIRKNVKKKGTIS